MVAFVNLILKKMMMMMMMDPSQDHYQYKKTLTLLIMYLCTVPALWVLLMIGADRGLAVPDNPGYEQWRLTCDQ